MDSQEKRRDTKKLQNKKRRQKWHFLRDFCVAFVGRKMKCEGQGELEGGGGHVENGMSKSKKQRRKCVRGKTNLWEMRQESARLAAVWWIGWWRWCERVGRSFCRVVDREEPVIWILWTGISEKMELYRKKGDENKTKKTSLLFGGESPCQVGWAERGKGEKAIG